MYANEVVISRLYLVQYSSEINSKRLSCICWQTELSICSYLSFSISLHLKALRSTSSRWRCFIKGAIVTIWRVADRYKLPSWINKYIFFSFYYLHSSDICTNRITLHKDPFLKRGATESTWILEVSSFFRHSGSYATYYWCSVIIDITPAR